MAKTKEQLQQDLKNAQAANETLRSELDTARQAVVSLEKELSIVRKANTLLDQELNEIRKAAPADHTADSIQDLETLRTAAKNIIDLSCSDHCPHHAAIDACKNCTIYTMAVKANLK